MFWGRKVFLDELGPGVNWELLRENLDIRLNYIFDQFLWGGPATSRWRKPVTINKWSIHNIRPNFLWHVKVLMVPPVPPPPSQ
ncbi:unnamed protein product [Musa acuminata subsp. malaccensis]|uniref:(wild Malaysian banana) hypothetical protein n=1 Tax=Musa acuminata subsp. malaccensis TaxID=214687 RepID=A0A804J045_MUSAM|nr:unnamed protein product [Musa acuminata subsp. malaccensis]